jgi:hypothetical protein
MDFSQSTNVGFGSISDLTTNLNEGPLPGAERTLNAHFQAAAVGHERTSQAKRPSTIAQDSKAALMPTQFSVP